MITEATTNVAIRSPVDAIELFNSRTAPGKLDAWQEYSTSARIAPFVPTTDAWDDSDAHRLVGEKLSQDVVTWTCHQLNRAAPAVGDVFTAWVVIDRTTRVTWVECSPVQNQRAMHPRAIHEAGKFPSSSRGTVCAHVFLRMDETWHEVLDSVLEACHEAKNLLDQCEGSNHSWAQDENAARKLLHGDGK